MTDFRNGVLYYRGTAADDIVQLIRHYRGPVKRTRVCTGGPLSQVEADPWLYIARLVPQSKTYSNLL